MVQVASVSIAIRGSCRFVARYCHSRLLYMSRCSRPVTHLVAWCLYSPSPHLSVLIFPYLSAPAQLNILLIRSTWNGCTLIRAWKLSFPVIFVMYLFTQIRAASKHSEESCCFSSHTRCTHNGNSSTDAFFFPRS